MARMTSGAKVGAKVTAGARVQLSVSEMVGQDVVFPFDVFNTDIEIFEDVQPAYLPRGQIALT
ncbi:hypothetical protein AYX13_07094 [Cryptococcus neoformans]|nr:hypothetical protein AYX13_07094 [Cryptococcus neoformans var. grubii]